MVEALDGLPSRKIHCSVLAEEAIKAALVDYYEKNGLELHRRLRTLNHTEEEIILLLRKLSNINNKILRRILTFLSHSTFKNVILSYSNLNESY